VSHSREQIVQTAIAVLDREGVKGLTLRGLAAELGGGLGSIYWYVEGKDQLVELACDELIGQALIAAGVAAGIDDEAVESPSDDLPSPRMEVDLATADPALLGAAATLRRIAVSLFAQMERHPWLATQAQLSGGERRNGLLVWEHFGRPLAAMGLTRRQQFHGSTALTGYVIGVAAEMSAQDQAVDPTLTGAQQLDQIVERWRAPEYAEFTWIRSISSEFRRHDDLAQFVAGLDLLLAGLVRQADSRRS